MESLIKKVVILGGGSAGWITAGLLAAEHKARSGSNIEITLIESPDVPTIGVGEGTVPSMRGTLHKIGVSENDFIRECSVSFKQGVEFVGWVTGKEDERYYGPFELPLGYPDLDMVAAWQSSPGENMSFADAVSFQGKLHEHDCAPKQISTPEYLAVANYAYHLDSAKLGAFLKKHCIDKLGVRHIADHVTIVNSAPDGDISSLTTKINGDIEGDLFIDCSGTACLLLGQHYKVPFLEKRDILFIDSALAVQVPYAEELSPIIPSTLSTAQKCGWIWDIGLSSRRGVGHVYSSAHTDDEQAEVELRAYLAKTIGEAEAESVTPRKLTFNPGYREEFWHRNCVAVGMASGFNEPLEASALMLVELSANMISMELPATRGEMVATAKRYNECFKRRWEKTVEFLKLHYVLSERTDSEFWIDNRRPESIPVHLQEQLETWRHRAPTVNDFFDGDSLFPLASYLYVLYGMKFKTELKIPSAVFSDIKNAQKYHDDIQQKGNKYLAGLPSTRELLEQLKRQGFPLPPM